MTLTGESAAEITARNAMLVFIMLAGIAQLFFIYPLAKFFSVDGTVSKDLKPTILAILLFCLVALVYEIPQVAVGIASLAIFPKEYFLLIMGLVVVWFFFAVVLLKSRFMRKISNVFGSSFERSLEIEIKKEK
jgi:cation-transporting ATPase E